MSGGTEVEQKNNINKITNKFIDKFLFKQKIYTFSYTVFKYNTNAYIVKLSPVLKWNSINTFFAIML